MNKHILEEPTAGVLTMQSMLKDKNIIVSYERVRRLMRKANNKTYLSKKTFNSTGRKELCVSLPLKKFKNRPSKSGVRNRHHLHTNV